MACEIANGEGRPCKMVVVADDCAIPRSKGETGARGVAGTIFVHKVARATAAAGKSLDELHAMASLCNSRIWSLGVALDAVTIPGATTMNNRLEGNKIEIGLGIHGEAGIRQSKMMSADEIAEEMVDTVHEFGYKPLNGSGIEKIAEGDNVALLVNNLGGTSNFELAILTRSIVLYLEKVVKCKVTRIFVGALMTSFDMHGVSLSILSLDENNKIAELLDEASDAPAWCKADVWGQTMSERPSATLLPEVVVKPIAASDVINETVSIPNFSNLAKAAISASCTALIENEPKLTEWDTIVGDGDCGITMARGANEVIKRLEGGMLPLESPSKLLAALADAISASMGGTSGIIFELMLRKASTYLMEAQKSGKVVDEALLSESFSEGVQAGSFYGGAKKGYRTMMDDLLPASDVSAKGIKAILFAASEGAESKSRMNEALAGRSNYLSKEQLENTPDPGAKAVSIILTAIVSVKLFDQPKPI